jgi:hypothetical protein
MPVLIEWGDSAARKILVEDLSNGMIGLDLPKPAVAWKFYSDNMIEFQYITESQFKGGLYRLRVKMKLNKCRNEGEEADFLHDMALFPRPEYNYRGEPHWDLSEAKPLLEADIKEGKYPAMMPKELWLTRPEYYDAYPLEVFRKHIHQEIRTQKWHAYLKDLKEAGDDVDFDDPGPGYGAPIRDPGTDDEMSL